MVGLGRGLRALRVFDSIRTRPLTIAEADEPGDIDLMARCIKDKATGVRGNADMASLDQFGAVDDADRKPAV